MPGFSISRQAIDCAALSAAMQADSAGAFVGFEGRVRDSNEGLPVIALEYEIFHELALSEGQCILAEAIETYGLIDAQAVHREGHLEIGDCAVWIGVTARHRGAAFDACRYAIDQVKHRLPIWKKEHYVGREPQWVNCQHHHAPALSADEFYARQMRLPEVGATGQAKLGNARVLVVGVGGLGSAAALALAGAGAGTIGLAEHDVLAASNLHRQLIYNADDIGRKKVDLASARLKALNPLVRVCTHAERVTTANVKALFKDYDVVLDCTDNFSTKYLLNDAAIASGKVLIQASIYRFEGQLMVIDGNGAGGCLRCLFPDPPPPGAVGDCAETGVLGTVPALFGTLQANEAIKYILGLDVRNDDMLTLDLSSLQSQRLRRQRRPDCAVCAGKAILTGGDNMDYEVQAHDTDENLRARFRFVDVREDWEIEQWPIGEAIHMPTSAFDVSALTVAKDEPLLLICAKGVRSRAAAEYLRGQGWLQAYSLAGGAASLPRKMYG